MLDIKEELKKFEPIPEVGDVEELVRNKDLTDMTDVMKMMVKESKEQDR